ncbi:MAG: aldo/keto reductase [Kaistia sp. SCN 65-12]|nr:MAG: aldo/keto reductase [Kaistia sp. SCN 65-12]
MHKRVLGSSGIEVSAVGLGCMGMSEFYGPSEDSVSLATLEFALASGVTLYDSADTYGVGHNEELLGRFIRGKRDRVVVATKCGIVREKGKYERRIDTSPAYIRSACEASLKRLGTDTIDLYYLHRLSADVAIEESVGALADLVKAGKIRSIGLCEVSAKTLARAHAVHPVSAVQSEYSLWTRDPEAEILPACRVRNVAFVAYSPLGRGFLTGRITSTEGLADNDFRRSNPRFQAENIVCNARLLEAVSGVADRHGCKTGQVALAWLLAQGKDIIPIPGTRRQSYLAENVGSAEILLDTDDLGLLDGAFRPEAISGERYTPEGMKGVNA